MADLRMRIAAVVEASKSSLTDLYGVGPIVPPRPPPVREGLDRPLWHFRFLRRPNVDGWMVSQVHGFARVDGIAGSVDLNIMRPRPPGSR